MKLVEQNGMNKGTRNVIKKILEIWLNVNMTSFVQLIIRHIVIKVRTLPW
jgi:hypothetical protein